MTDNVNEPERRESDRELECIYAIRAQLTPEEYEGYLRGNVAKYVWRRERERGAGDLRKAQWYLQRLIWLREEDGDGSL